MNDIPSLCECGCGEITPLATHTDSKRGVKKGQPLRFVHGHNRRRPVTAEYLIDPRTGCWIWQRAVARARGGYGISYDKQTKKPKDAHRVFYERVHGPVPAGMHLHHKCGNPPCVNPDHLEALTRSAHMVETRRTGYPVARLTPEQVREIRAAPRGYGTGRALARKFGVPDAVISNVRVGLTYKQIK